MKRDEFESLLKFLSTVGAVAGIVLWIMKQGK